MQLYNCVLISMHAPSPGLRGPEGAEATLINARAEDLHAALCCAFTKVKLYHNSLPHLSHILCFRPVLVFCSAQNTATFASSSAQVWEDKRGTLGRVATTAKGETHWWIFNQSLLIQESDLWKKPKSARIICFHSNIECLALRPFPQSPHTPALVVRGHCCPTRHWCLATAFS